MFALLSRRIPLKSEIRKDCIVAFGDRVYNTGKVQIGLRYFRPAAPISVDGEWVQAAFLNRSAAQRWTWRHVVIEFFDRIINGH